MFGNNIFSRSLLKSQGGHSPAKSLRCEVKMDKLGPLVINTDGSLSRDLIDSRLEDQQK